MGKYQVDLASIKRRLPAGFAMPAGLRELGARCQRAQRGTLGWFALKYANPNSLVGGDARAELVPFMILPDGGWVGFWFKTRSAPRVVWLGSEGETDVVARSWPEFARQFARGSTGVEDIDDRRSPDDEKEVVSRRAPKPPASLGRELRAWIKSLQPKPPKGVAGERGEPIRKAILKVLKKWLKRRHDSETLVVDYTSRTYRVSWYAGGLKPFPRANALREPLAALKDAFGRSLAKSEIVVWGNGTVIFEDNTIVGKEQPI